MASILQSSQVADGVQARARDGVNIVKGTYELLAALVVNDVIQMVKVPEGATICEVILATDDLDTATALVLQVGDDGDVDRFIKDQSAVGQAAGVCRLDQVDGLGYKYTAENTIDVKVTTAPGTGATSGTITLIVTYHMEGFN